MKLDGKLLFRLLFYFGGLLVLAFGIALAIRSDLGISPVSSPSFAAYNVLLTRGIQSVSYGTCVTISYAVYMVAQMVVLRREYKLINLLQIVVSTVFGWFVDFAVAVVGPTSAMPYFGRLGFLAAAAACIAVGISFYVGAGVMPMPNDGLNAALVQKLKNRTFPWVKMRVDCVLVTLAIIISLVGAGRIIGIREGTVVTALFVGPLMGVLKRWIDPFIRRLGFGAATAAQL